MTVRHCQVAIVVTMSPATDSRTRIVDAAVKLIETDGLAAVTTRAVAAAAGVKSPAIYRLFNDMQGLLDAVVVHGFSDYMRNKADASETDDPVQALRAGWDSHIAFGLQHPELYRLMYAPSTAGQLSQAAKIAFERLLGIVRRIARAGRLIVDTFTAADMMHSGAMGVTFTLLNTPAAQRDEDLPRRMRELILGAVTDGLAVPDPMSSGHLASALNEHLDETVVTLSPGERALLGEILTRIARETTDAWAGSRSPGAGPARTALRGTSH